MKIKNKDSSIIITITPEAIISRGKDQEVDITPDEARSILARLSADPEEDYSKDRTLAYKGLIHKFNSNTYKKRR